MAKRTAIRPIFWSGLRRRFLNGKDLTGWVSQNGKEQQWVTDERRSLESDRKPSAAWHQPEPGGTIVQHLPRLREQYSTRLKNSATWSCTSPFCIPKGSNSGVYLHGLYEVQIFDSYGSWEPMSVVDGRSHLPSLDRRSGSGRLGPRVNANRRPANGRASTSGSRVRDSTARERRPATLNFLKVLQNGVSVQENVEVDGGTRAHMSIPKPRQIHYATRGSWRRGVPHIF
jgi:hypothetical protein